MTTRLRYRGDGRWLVGVPARDLNGDDLARLPERLRRRLVPSGLYAPATKPPVRAQEDQPHE